MNKVNTTEIALIVMAAGVAAECTGLLRPNETLVLSGSITAIVSGIVGLFSISHRK